MSKKTQNPITNSGFSSINEDGNIRLTNKDGSFNVLKKGIPFLQATSFYHSFLSMSRFNFVLSLLAIYFSIILIFAFIYYGLSFIIPNNFIYAQEIGVGKFASIFFFSAQTITTLGYGHEYPVGLITNIISTLEALIGILLFSLMTGMVYGRFTRPRAFILFSANLLISPYSKFISNGKALMLRLASYKNNHLSDVEVNGILTVHKTINDNVDTKFYPLTFELSKINNLALSWTVVHPIIENSPLINFNEQDFLNHKIEIIINIKAFDSHFSNTVIQSTTYNSEEIIFGAKFVPMFYTDLKLKKRILELNKINMFEKIIFED